MEIDNDSAQVPVAGPARQPYPPSYTPAPYAPAPGPPGKSPLLAALFAFVMPGLGHIYVGVYQRALIIFAAWVGTFWSAVNSKEETEISLLIPVLIFLWLFSAFDAYRQATFSVWGEPDEVRALARDRGKNGLSFGIALLALGLYGLLRKYFDFDLSFLLEHWYLVVLIAGGWMVWQALAASRERSGAAD